MSPPGKTPKHGTDNTMADAGHEVDQEPADSEGPECLGERYSWCWFSELCTRRWEGASRHCIVMTTHKIIWKLFTPTDGSEDRANAAESDGEGDIGSEEGNHVEVTSDHMDVDDY
jgi:hypothetical protein